MCCAVLCSRRVQVETAARTESESGATGAAADAGAVAAGASAGAGEQQAEGEAAAHVEQSECESGIEKGESNVQVERSSIDSTGSLSPVRQEPPQEPPTPLPESDEQRARRVYEEKLERVKQVANELGSGSAKVLCSLQFYTTLYIYTTAIELVTSSGVNAQYIAHCTCLSPVSVSCIESSRLDWHWQQAALALALSLMLKLKLSPLIWQFD